MKNRINKCLFLLFIVLFAYLLKEGNNSVHKSPKKTKYWIINELKAGNYNNQALINGNNPLQIVNYRTVKSGRFVKTLFTGIISVIVCLKYLKYKFKSINSEYARFLKLLLFPSHVFW